MDESKIIKTYNAGINAVITVVKDMSSRIDLLGGTITRLNTEIIGLNDQVDNLNGAIQKMKESNAKQEVRIAELEAILNKDSNNSSKPPSQDGYRKAPKNSRQKSGKTTGGQPGHQGRTLEKVMPLDEIIEITIQTICDCGCNLERVEDSRRTRQVFDIPKPQIYPRLPLLPLPGCGSGKPD